ncbi:NERD domain-containing protein [Flagellimonas flava]|uniref:nuclease-related domain-containing protein n=1 Tax=Flagellimonas flava TaxID=570519 RepID=UPI003D661F64
MPETNMDSLTPYLLITIILAALAYRLFKKYYLPKIYGSLGEFYVSRTLKRLGQKDYIVHNNIYLEKNGRTSQIDHLVISIYGIFVIETKTYKGWIYGNENSKYWTQTLYRKKYKLYNPILQNWSHINFIKGLSRSLTFNHYFPIVVFAGKAKLKRIESSVPVIYRRKLIRTIRRKKDVLFTHGEMHKINAVILNYLVSGSKIKKEHRKHTKKTVKRSKKRTDFRACPRCGGKLVAKDGKYGKFYGCSNYPSCNFTKNIK